MESLPSGDEQRSISREMLRWRTISAPKNNNNNEQLHIILAFDKNVKQITFTFGSKCWK